MPVMLLLGSVHGILLVTIAWCLGQAVMNVYQAALTSVVPDRVPLASRGRASAAVGLGLPVGSTVGALIGAAFSDDYRTGYLVFGAIVAATAVLFTSLAREERMPPKSPMPVRAQLAAFGSALKDHDFRWAFLGRALLVLGYFAVAGFQLYVLKDHTDLPAGLSPEEAVAVLMPVNSVAMVVSTVLGGWLSDRYDRRKLFVGASAALAAVALLIPAVSSSWTAMLAFSVVNGLGFGCYMAVDTALVTMVLPKAEDAARDMGVLNIANAGRRSWRRSPRPWSSRSAAATPRCSWWPPCCPCSGRWRCARSARCADHGLPNGRGPARVGAPGPSPYARASGRPCGPAGQQFSSFFTAPSTMVSPSILAPGTGSWVQTFQSSPVAGTVRPWPETSSKRIEPEIRPYTAATPSPRKSGMKPSSTRTGADGVAGFVVPGRGSGTCARSSSGAGEQAVSTASRPAARTTPGPVVRM
ncbi:MFS transporter [Streptomyces roseicoloratus]|uniref:MFS transporter n=1 Tax=Streptomyces roseicoloratus TaxID=2508722 RepID=A0ABY9S445_9ACTN|nr:MFS transporter [Streptomyces roseicoloratus]WMX48718.1 MFS transporter [Streptomyces roseicoloratus]